MNDYTATKSGILIPVEPVDSHKREVEFGEGPTPEWERFFRCNHERVPEYNVRRGGGIEFSNHFGKPLSQRLWEDITQRLHIRTLWVLRPPWEEWTIGHIGTHLTLYLDDKDYVVDAYYSP